MSTDTVSASTLRTLEEYQKSTKSTATSGTNLDIDDFLKLFVAQLSSQDPLSGSSSSSSGGTDYISQLAQLTMLEQLSDLGDSLATNQAYSMIGKYVYIGESTDSELIFGKVDGVINEGGINYLMVGGDMYSQSEVYAVIDPDKVAEAEDDAVLKSADLIGKTVTATVKNAAGETSTVTGKVDKILVKDGVVYLVVGDKNIALSSVTEIAGAATTTA